MIHNDSIIHLCVLVNNTWNHAVSQFSLQMVSVVLKILNTCVLDIYVVSVV